MCFQSKNFGLIQSYRKVGNDFELTVEGNSLWKFFDGDWLEIFTFQSAIESKCFDYLDYGLKFSGNGMNNELDLVATSKASLWIAECKTEEDYKVENLEKLSSIASTLGGKYVGRFLILSNFPHPHDEGENKSFESYWQKAKTRDVVVITGHKLKNLPQIFQSEINSPTFPRG
jgi:Holliday junction resolvase